MQGLWVALNIDAKIIKYVAIYSYVNADGHATDMCIKSVSELCNHNNKLANTDNSELHHKWTGVLHG